MYIITRGISKYYSNMNAYVDESIYVLSHFQVYLEMSDNNYDKVISYFMVNLNTVLDYFTDNVNEFNDIKVEILPLGINVDYFKKLVNGLSNKTLTNDDRKNLGESVERIYKSLLLLDSKLTKMAFI